MAAEIIMRVYVDSRGRRALVPAGREGEETLETLTPGAEVKASIVQQGRNLQRLRLYFALMNEIFPHQDMYQSVTKLRRAVMCAIGFCETLPLPDGREILITDSIAFANMEEPDFILVLEKSIEFIYRKIIPGVASDDLMRRVNEILEGR